MKELSIEEKAKAYDNIINRMKHYVVDEYGCSRIKVADVFPELKESEDERILKHLKAVVKAYDMWAERGLDMNDILAWLEKKGEQKSADGTFVNVDDVREDFVQEVYRVLDADSTNDRANQIIDAFDNLPTVTIENANKVEPRQEKLTEFEKAVKQVMEEAIECGDTRNLKADAEMLLSLVHKSAWSEEDKVMLGEIIDFFENGTVKLQHDLSLYASWLKSLKGRVQPQNGYNPYKEVVESIAVMCKHYDKASHSDLQDFYDNVKVKCKDAKEYDSLYPQSTWKPSDEQIEALEYSLGDYNIKIFEDRYKILKSLYNELKKLRGE